MLRQLLGGPLLTAAVLAAALGVSYARRRDEKRRQQQSGSGARDVAPTAAAGAKGDGKYFAVLSAEALKLLVSGCAWGPYSLLGGSLLHVKTARPLSQTTPTLNPQTKVATHPLPRCIIDVRGAEAAEVQPLPLELASAAVPVAGAP